MAAMNARGFFASISAVILLIAAIAIIVSEERTDTRGNALEVERERARALALTLDRLVEHDIPQAVRLAQREAVLELGDSLTEAGLASVSEGGSIEHPLDAFGGLTILSDQPTITIDTYDITSIEHLDPYTLLITSELEMTIETERVELEVSRTGSDALTSVVSIVGVVSPYDHLEGPITRGGFKVEPSRDCFLKEVISTLSCLDPDGNTVNGVIPE